MHGLAGAFSALGEPRSERGGETIGLYPKAGFQCSFTQGKRVVKFGGIREISHAEAVEPIERAGSALSCEHNVHLIFLRVHSESIAEGDRFQMLSNAPTGATFGLERDRD